jgi:hypothetical protein
MKVLWRGAIGIHKLRHPVDSFDQDAGCSA